MLLLNSNLFYLSTIIRNLFYLSLLILNLKLYAQSENKNLTKEEKPKLYAPISDLLFFQYNFGVPQFAGLINDKKQGMLTYEHLHLHKTGTTFYFVDLMFGAPIYPNKNGVPQKVGTPLNVNYIYTELGHDINAFFLKNKYLKNLSLHVEINAGVTANFLSIPTSFLAGIGYTHFMKYKIGADDNLGILKVLVLAKQTLGDRKLGGQLTGIWEIPLGRRAYFRGFADIWKVHNPIYHKGIKSQSFMFISEPQILFTVKKGLSIGTEIHLSKNLFSEHFAVYPSIALKVDLSK